MNITDIQLKLDELPWTRTDNSLMTPSLTVQSQGTPDLLATMFAGQRRLMEKYEEIERSNGAIVPSAELFGQLDDRTIQIRIKDLGYRVVEELSEATNCLKNKPWKNSFIHTDVEHFYEELSDAIHFFIELLITAGLGPEDVFKLYFLKNAVNQFRQESNY